MNSAVYDLLVIGGGINGAAIARDAAGRGQSVLLVEKDDLASHTSSASSKLIHGGLRYLEQYEFGLVRESLHEREILLRNAPHLVRNLAFVVPAYDWWEGPFYGVGLRFYIEATGNIDALAARVKAAGVTLARDAYDTAWKTREVMALASESVNSERAAGMVKNNQERPKLDQSTMPPMVKKGRMRAAQTTCSQCLSCGFSSAQTNSGSGLGGSCACCRRDRRCRARGLRCVGADRAAGRARARQLGVREPCWADWCGPGSRPA